MEEQAIRVLNTVGVLKSWAGADPESREVLRQLCKRGYVYRVARKLRAGLASGRPPSYRLTEIGRAVLNDARLRRRRRAENTISL
jgi:hypothetical protein